MSAILKDENFVAVEPAAEAGTAPAEIASAFPEWPALREPWQRSGPLEGFHLKASSPEHHHRSFVASNFFTSN